MPIISLLIFSSKFTLQYLLRDSALDSSNISPFQGAWREALSAKETEGIMQKSGASFLVSGAAFGFVDSRCRVRSWFVCGGTSGGSAWAVRPQHTVAQWPHFPGLTLVTTLPQPPRCISGLAPTAGFPHPFTLTYQSWLLYSESCFLVWATDDQLWPRELLCHCGLQPHFLQRGLTSSHGKGPSFKVFLPWGLSLSPRLPFRVLFIFSVIFLSYLSNSLH